MKNFFTTCLLVFNIISFGQEAGKAGELLKNEASKNEMAQKNGNISKREGTLDNSGFRNNQNKNNRGNDNPGYNWNQNYGFGYAEIFIRIPERGFYTVEVGDQMASNSVGKYRFFDLIPGVIPVSIYDNGYLVYRSRINVRNNSRLVLDYFTNRGLYLLATYPLQNQGYGNYGEIWNDMWNSPYNGNNGNWNPYNGMPDNNYGNSNQGNLYGNVLSNSRFNAFLQVVRDTKFGNDKIAVIKQQLRSTMITSEQVKRLLESFTFDNDRLEVAKFAYPRCVDPENYFMVYPVFQFQNSAQELRDFILKL